MQPMEGVSRFNEQWALAAVINLLLFGALATLVSRVGWPVSLQSISADYAVLLGRGFMTHYLLPFEATSVVLLVALVGAIVIARD